MTWNQPSIPCCLSDLRSPAPPVISLPDRVDFDAQRPSRRYAQQQGHHFPVPAKLQNVFPRQQGPEAHTTPLQGSLLAFLTLSPAPQTHPITGQGAAHPDFHPAQAPPGAEDGRTFCPAIRKWVNGSAGKQNAAVFFYRSSFALTRYCPPTTPPNKYFPMSLVLVVATRTSLPSTTR